MTKIAFIGLGNMGAPMARNLLKAGHDVIGFDLNEDAIIDLCAFGATGAVSVADAVSSADFVITMLPNGAIVKATYGGSDGILASAASGALLIDSSTISVADAREVIANAKAAGFDMLDAPVSGGTAGANAGTLAFMVGGSDEAFARAKPIIDAMAGKIVHAGGAGNGQAAKVCNNMLLAISMIGTGEAFNLGRKLGLDDQVFFDVAANASGQSWSLTSYCPVPGPVPTSPANNDYKPGFATALMLKDLGLAVDAIEETGVNSPLGELSQKLYAAMNNQGHGGVDFSGIIKYLDGSL